MVIVSTMHNRPEVRIRFTRGTCVDGVDYGPGLVDRPVTLPEHAARWYVETRKRAVYCKDALPLQPEPEAESSPLIATKRGRRK